MTSSCLNSSDKFKSSHNKVCAAFISTPTSSTLLGTLMSELALEDGQVVQKQKLPLSLTFDHQVIDGAPAADFLARVIFYLEHPYTLVL